MAATMLALPLDKMLANQLADDLAIEGETSSVSFAKNFSAINDRTWIGENFGRFPWKTGQYKMAACNMPVKKRRIGFTCLPIL